MKCERCGKKFRDVDKLDRHCKQHGADISMVSEEFGQEMEEIIQRFTGDISRLCLQEGMEDEMGIIFLTAFQHVLALTLPRENDILAFVEFLEHVTKAAVEEGVLKPST